MGFADDHEHTNESSADFKPEIDATRALKSSLESISKDWFDPSVFYRPDTRMRTDQFLRL